MNIYLEKGVGNLDFSMNSADLLSSLGQPTSIDTYPNDQKIYYYDDIGLAVIYLLEDSREVISSFELEKGTYTFLNFPLIGRKYTEIIKLFGVSGIEDYKEENHYSTRYIFYKNLSIEFENDFASVITLYNPNLD